MPGLEIYKISGYISDNKIINTLANNKKFETIQDLSEMA